MLINLSGATTGNVSISLENKSNFSFSGIFSFVDADILQYGTTGVRVCKSENEKNIFGQYVELTTSSFTIEAQEIITRTLKLQFPSWYSGLYYGCIVYYPNINENEGALNTLARKSIFLDVKVDSVDDLFNFKVYPSDRSNSLKKGVIGSLYFYDINNTGDVLFSGEVQTNPSGTGEFFANIPNGEYFVVYKGLSHLASYISGFIITGSESVFDFTTGNNLFKTKEYSSSIDDGYRYQIAGDLKNINGVYDGKINVNDITILCTVA